MAHVVVVAVMGRMPSMMITLKFEAINERKLGAFGKVVYDYEIQNMFTYMFTHNGRKLISHLWPKVCFRGHTKKNLD